MRPPDLEAVIERDSQAFLWHRAGIEAALALANSYGVELTEDDVQLAAQPVTDEEMVARAWRMHFDEEKLVPGQKATLTSWLVNGPFHPHWRWWVVGTKHLREVAGSPVPVIRFPGATHEVMIVAIDPTTLLPPLEEIEAMRKKVDYLVPLDLVHQVVLRFDEDAVELVEMMIEEIMAGRMSPDADFAGRWARMLDDTAEHLRYGGHPGDN